MKYGSTDQEKQKGQARNLACPFVFLSEPASPMRAVTLAGFAAGEHENSHDEKCEGGNPKIPFFHSANRFYIYKGECSQNARLTKII